MEGINGGRGSSWSYHEELGQSSNISSSRSGTIASTAYTSSVSRPSTVSMGAAMHFVSLGIHGDANDNNVQDWDEAEEEETEEEEDIRSPVQEFFGAPSANCSLKRGDMSVLDRWLKKLGVGWVIHLDDGAPAGEELYRDAQSWIWALDKIAQTICSTRPLFPDHGSISMGMGLPSICDEEGEPVAERSLPHQYHSALFIRETMLKMLAFVDVVVALYPNTAITCGMLAPYLKTSILLLVRDALSEASTKISLASHPPPSTQVRGIQDEMASLFSAKQGKATEAIRDTMEDTWARIMESVEHRDDDDSVCSRALDGLSDIHDVTRSVTFHISYVWLNYCSLYPIVFEAANRRLGKHATKIGGTTSPMDKLIIQMISYLEEKLAKRSRSFPDKGLRYLFLINNLSYIWQRLHRAYVSRVLTCKVEDYIHTYLQESWEPVLSCFTQPRCFGKTYSHLPKFESAFQRNYNTQKLWKVPDPQLRQRLRKAITEKIISVLDDNCVSTLKFTPENLEEMLQQLFEG